MRKTTLFAVSGITILLLTLVTTTALKYDTTAKVEYTPYPGAPTYTFHVDENVYYAVDKFGETQFSGYNATTVFNLAEDEAGPNSHLYFTAGTYLLSGTVGLNVNHENVSVSGDGRYNSYFTTANGSNLDAFIKVSEDWCSITSLGLRGSNQGVNSDCGIIVTNSADYLTVDDCYVGHFVSYGIYLTGGNNVFNIRNNYIGWFSTYNGSDSAAIFASGSADGHIVNNQLAGGKHVLRASTIGSTVIVGNKVFGCSDTYLYLDCPVRCVISNNIVGGAAPTGTNYVIYVLSYSPGYGHSNVISNNVLYGSNLADDIIRFRGSKVWNNTVTGNYLENSYRGVHEYDGTENWNCVVGNVFVNVDVPLELEGQNSTAQANCGAGV